MIELVNLEDYDGCVVKVLRRDDKILYGKIERFSDNYRPFVFNLGNSGICYSKNGRVMDKAHEFDIIWIKK